MSVGIIKLKLITIEIDKLKNFKTIFFLKIRHYQLRFIFCMLIHITHSNDVTKSCKHFRIFRIFFHHYFQINTILKKFFK